MSDAADVQRDAAAWTFYKEHEEEVNWDMVYILPAYVRSHCVPVQRDGLICGSRFLA